MRIYKPVLLGLLPIFVLSSFGLGPGYAARLDTEDKLTTKPVPAAQAPQGKTGTGNLIHLNFRDADLLQIINLMSELTGKNFLVDDKVKGKITIIAPKPVTLDEAYQVFLSLLEIQGFTVVPQGPIIKIVPSREVKERPLPLGIDGQRPPSATSDAFVTQLIPMEHADANEIRALLTPLVSKQSSLLAYPPTNTLILTDVSSNIARLLKIIRTLDIESPAAILKVITLKHASAEQIAASLQLALEGLVQVSSADGETPTTPRARRTRPAATQQATAKAPKIIPDNRTNSLVVIATPVDMDAAENLIAKLDIPTPEGRSQIHVYYLAHANAEELAKVLTAQAGEIARTTGSRETPGTTSRTGVRRPTTPTPPTATTPTGAPVTATTATGVTITADKSTNALVISAPPEAYEALKGIIEKLDVRRSQVLVESLIAEVTFDKTRELGVEWRIINEPNGTQVFASSTGGAGTLNQLTVNPLLPVSGFLIGALRNSITIGGRPPIFNIPAILRAFQSDTDVNILATPNLLTTDNEEAEIIIGEERPFLRSSLATPLSGAATQSTNISTTNTFEFRDTGITLRLTPQISQGRTVRLNLSQEIKNFLSESQPGAVTTSKRSAKTTVIVDDGQTIVIGGLIQEDRNEAQTQVPCLGNLPVLGWAFRQTSDRKRKTNLLIFITPHIITSPEDVRRVTDHKLQQSDKSEDIERQLQENRPQENLEILLN